ncbi:MAG TPA: hypothetical protein GX714_04700 [Chloroflexi bacterium]|jgi:recombination protein RecA|nr:hypothetical protein [Chloroflexota bacterium]
MMAQSRQTKALEATVAALQRRWGARAIYRLGDTPESDVPVCPTGLDALDDALGIGGLPRGKFSELIGYGTAGQATVAARVLAQAQGGGQQVAYVDVGATVDIDNLVRCGVCLEGLTILRPQGFTHALAMTGDLLRAGGVAAVVFDRVHDLYLLTGSDAHAAFHRAVRDWTPVIAHSLNTFLFITEVSAPEVYPGDLPLPYMASVRLAFRRLRWLQRGARVVGYAAEVTVIKNRLGPPHQRVTLEIVREDGITME